MANRSVDIASKASEIAGDIAFAAVDSSMAIAASEELASNYQRLAEVLAVLAAGTAAASEAFKEFSLEQKRATESVEADKELGAFWFMDLYGDGYKNALGKYEKESTKFLERKQEETGKYIDIERELAAAVEGYNVIHSSAMNARTAVFNSAYKAMEDQMLSFIETGEFSGEAFAKIVAQQVKVELVGLSARAAVWAIYETAMGLKDLALGLPTAGLHFASAGKFAAVSAAALVGAAGAQQMLESVGAGGSSTSGSSTGSSTDIVPMASTQENVPVQQVTVNIYNPLSDENWQRIVEEDIIPALNDASERNVSVRLNVVG